MSFGFKAAYAVGFKPWDSGQTPPELKALIEGPKSLRPGRALDLGCGTGTNTVYMSRRGWDVTGVDFVPKAIEQARRKAQESKVSPRLLVGDVTKLDELKVGDGFGLVFDLGCYHSIPEKRRDFYVSGVTAATAPGAVFLVWGFRPKANPMIRTGLTAEELESRFKQWDLVRSWGGEQPDRFPGGWFQLQRQ